MCFISLSGSLTRGCHRLPPWFHAKTTGANIWSIMDLSPCNSSTDMCTLDLTYSAGSAVYSSAYGYFISNNVHLDGFSLQKWTNIPCFFPYYFLVSFVVHRIILGLIPFILTRPSFSIIQS
jgi:hypothetical protein